MTEKVKVANVKDIAQGTSKYVEAAGKKMAIFNVGGEFFAISNTCGHAGGPLADGSLAGEVVTCSWHGFEFDVKTGECLTNPSLGIEKYKVIVENDEVFVEV